MIQAQVIFDDFASTYPHFQICMRGTMPTPLLKRCRGFVLLVTQHKKHIKRLSTADHQHFTRVCVPFIKDPTQYKLPDYNKKVPKASGAVLSTVLFLLLLRARLAA